MTHCYWLSSCENYKTLCTFVLPELQVHAFMGHSKMISNFCRNYIYSILQMYSVLWMNLLVDMRCMIPAFCAGVYMIGTAWAPADQSIRPNMSTSGPGFKAFTDYTEQRTCEQHGGFLCITAFGVGKKIPLCPLLLFLSLHPHTLPNQGWRDHLCTCRWKALRTGGMCTHTCGAGMCVCVNVSNHDIINYLAMGFLQKDT